MLIPGSRRPFALAGLTECGTRFLVYVANLKASGQVFLGNPEAMRIVRPMVTIALSVAALVSLW